MIKAISAKVISNKQIATDIFLITFHAPKIAYEAHPGQFVMLAAQAEQSILSSPMAIYDANPDTGKIKIGFLAIGPNTQRYSELNPKDALTITGPLGSQHNFNLTSDHYILVGGGIGITSLHLIGKHLKSQGKKITTLAGARSKDYIAYTEDFETFGDVHIATDDGSDGHHGYIHELLEKHITENTNTNIQVIYCGPHIMMQACAGVCKKHGAKHLAVMEEMMACGFGICMACVCQTTAGQKKVCTDGPIFDGSTLTWKTEQTSDTHE